MECKTRVLLVFAATVAWGSQALAEDLTPDILGDGAAIASPQTEEIVKPVDFGEAPNLHASIQLELPTWRSLGVSESFVSQVTMTPEIPGSSLKKTLN